MIRKAIIQDIEKVEKGYIELLLHEQEHGAYTVWQMSVYPTRETAQKALDDETLYVMEENGEIYASMIVNQVQPEEYRQIQWKTSVADNEVLVIHLLCVRPSKAGCGVGKRMVQFVIDEAERMNCRSVRLDTGSQNTPAVALYTKLGFELAGTSSMSIGGLISHHHHLFFERKV